MAHAFWITVWALVTMGGEAGLAAPRTLVNGTGATVGKTLITIEDAYFYRALHRFKDGVGDPLTPETGEDLRKTLQKMAFEEMVTSEMKSFKFEPGRKGEIENEIRSARQKGKDKTWRLILNHFSKSEREALDRLRKSLGVERFLQRKAETLTPVITQSEIEKYYRQNSGKFGGKELDAVKENITLTLKKERMQKGLEEWIRFLKEKYGVTNHLGG